MRIILAGKHELSCTLFEILKKSFSKNTLGFITSKSEDQKRRKSLKRLLSKHKILALNKDFSDQELKKVILIFKPDLVISAGFDKILKRDLIKKIPLAINIHFGLLPKYRGSFSIPWAIINEEKYIGITIHKIVPGIDSGEIILQSKIKNDPNLSCKQIYFDAVKYASLLTKKVLDSVQRGKKLITTRQDTKKATFFPFKKPYDFQIDWSSRAKFVFNLIRAAFFPPYDPAYSILQGRKIFFYFPINLKKVKLKFSPGEIIYYQKNYYIACQDGLIKPQKVRVAARVYNFNQYVKLEKLECHPAQSL
ncbi:hypothetical protein HYS91_03000 [Candidatus Daviesbacteria bacterium]|nr:hypothetical protein [Candidatus Daviesbacteria bacterium]